MSPLNVLNVSLIYWSMLWCFKPGKADLLFLIPACILFYPTASNFIIAIINHVHTHFDAKKAGYHFTAQQMSLAPQKLGKT